MNNPAESFQTNLKDMTHQKTFNLSLLHKNVAKLSVIEIN